MATKKIRDIVAKTGEYIDHNGNKKGRYTNAGSLFYNDEEKSFFIIMNRCFNPAGVPPTDKGEPDSVLLSCFDPERKDGGNSNQSRTTAADYSNASGGSYTNQVAQDSHQRPLDDETDIPF